MALTDNLISHWKLNESSGNAADSVGSNTLTNTNVTYAAAKLNNGAVFNGTSAALSVPSGIYGLFDSRKAWSVGVWVKFNDTGTNQTIFRCSSGDANNGFGAAISFIRNTSNEIQIFRYDGTSTGSNTKASGTVTSGVWYYVVATYDGTNLKAYLNSTPGSSVSSTFNAPACVVGRFGRWVESNTSYYWLNGTLDESSIWSRALSADEVSQLFNSGRANAYPFTDTPSLYGCREYHKLDSDYTDATGSGNTASNTGTVITTGGILNSCAAFTSDYIRSAITPGTDGAISAWFKYDSFGAGVIVGNTAIGVSDYLRIYPYDSTHIQFAVKDDTINATVSTFGTTWHHVVLTWSSSEAWKAYYDGSLVATGTGIKNPTNSYTVPFGVLGNGSGIYSTPFYFPGYMDEIGIFNRFLSSMEISALYNSGAGLAYPWTSTGYTLALSQGAFTLTGNALGLPVTRYLPLTSGTYTLTGYAQNILARFKLSLEKGTFTYTGNNVILQKVYPLIIGTGTFAVTGFDLGFKVFRKLIAQAGNYVLTGINLLFDIPGRIQGEDKPTTTFINDTKVNIGETWDSITTTWGTETRTWGETASVIDNDTRQSTVITNDSKP